MAVIDARKAVLDWLVECWEWHATEEQLARGRQGEGDKAEFHHQQGLYVLRALGVEERDPEPKGPCSCQECSRLYARAGA